MHLLNTMVSILLLMGPKNCSIPWSPSCSFWGPSGEWDWSLDANQRWMLLAAKQRGAEIFEAFSNTPPYWMTVSGRSSGNVFPWLDNLRPEYYDQFVHYLTEVVRWYHDEHDITFRSAFVALCFAIYTSADSFATSLPPPL